MPRKASTTSSKKTTTKRSTKANKTSSEELSGVEPLATQEKVVASSTTKRTRNKKVKSEVDLDSTTLKQLLGGMDDDIGFGLSNLAFNGDIHDIKAAATELNSSKAKTTRISTKSTKKVKNTKLSTSLWKLGLAANVGGDSISSAIEDFYNIYKQNTTKPPLGYADAIDNSIFGQYQNRDGGFKYMNNWTSIYKNYNEPDTKVTTLEIHNKYLKLFDN
ncbi:hypothetical protein [[Mycoplasma] imitans]|uniref:hypothetical protein n=1 Tax=[Mycoplasma] imitans TaxID=29560 RepID=UPI0004878B06|nr:hypothetical protein [[Mycoplasma] imitans]